MSVTEVPALSRREVQVLGAYATGLTRAEVGELLFMSMDTVKTHLRRISQRLGTSGTTHSVAVAIRAGLLDSEPQTSAPPRQTGRLPDRPPPPADIAKRFPSTGWGVEEWFLAFRADDNLFFNILRGIGKAPL